MNFAGRQVMGTRSRISKTPVVTRRLLAVACLLIPTVLSLTTQCESAYLFRIIIGMAAFVIVSGLMSSTSMPGATAKKVDGDEKLQAANCVVDKEPGVNEEPLKNKGVAANDSLVTAPKHVEVILLTPSEPKESSTLFDFSIKPREISAESKIHASPNKSKALEEQVSNLLTQLEPTPSCRKVTQTLCALVQRHLDTMMPGAKALVFLSGPFWKSAPFVSSVPDIEVVISASPAQRQAFLHKHWQKQHGAPPHVAKAESSKWILRIVSKQMLKLKERHFRWRRSNYCLPEAKVVLMAPDLGSADQLVAFDLSLNAGHPLHNALLVVQASQFHPSIKGLLQFVRRWAKVRGMAQASMGYLSTYTWTLLVIYFLQVSAAVLPPVCCSEDSQGQPLLKFEGEVGLKSAVGVAGLFEAFVRFYSRNFDWLHEEVCLTTGRRKTTAYDRDAHPLEHHPQIQDPFRPNDNDIASLVTAPGMERAKQEFELALILMESEAPLTMLFQQWIPEEASEDATACQ